ncbi:MAG: hypothetical protein AAGJ55_01335 [Cyanobacteria bacterium J06555_12]
MNDGRPKLIAIDRDDYHAEHVGRLSDGRQFFLTTPFEPKGDDTEGAEFVALFLFDCDGKFIEAVIDNFGPRSTMDSEAARACYQRRLEELGQVEYRRIEVVPFSVQKFGIEFGLIPREPEGEDGVWAVELLPGNYMAFFEPWDSGEYDT